GEREKRGRWGGNELCELAVDRARGQQRVGGRSPVKSWRYRHAQGAAQGGGVGNRDPAAGAAGRQRILQQAAGLRVSAGRQNAAREHGECAGGERRVQQHLQRKGPTDDELRLRPMIDKLSICGFMSRVIVPGLLKVTS